VHARLHLHLRRRRLVSTPTLATPHTSIPHSRHPPSPSHVCTSGAVRGDGRVYEEGSDPTSGDADLSLEERNLLSVAYKNVVGARCASLRIIGSIQSKEESKGDGERVSLISAYKSKVEMELNSICDDILQLLKATLIRPPSAPSPRSSTRR